MYDTEGNPAEDTRADFQRIRDICEEYQDQEQFDTWDERIIAALRVTEAVALASKRGCFLLSEHTPTSLCTQTFKHPHLTARLVLGLPFIRTAPREHTIS